MENKDPKETAPRELGAFLKFTFLKILEKKKLYLLPLWVLLVATAILLLLTGNGHLLPAIYLLI